jgi:hypothetical protein
MSQSVRTATPALPLTGAVARRTAAEQLAHEPELRHALSMPLLGSRIKLVTSGAAVQTGALPTKPPVGEFADERIGQHRGRASLKYSQYSSSTFCNCDSLTMSKWSMHSRRSEPMSRST